MTDAELEQLYAQCRHAGREYREHIAAADGWKKRRSKLLEIVKREQDQRKVAHDRR